MNPESLPQEFPRDVLERSRDACFTVSESLEITYCNTAWDRFASENQGAANVLSGHVLSKPLLGFMSADVGEYYLGLFLKARELCRPVTHDYECSSATMYRLYRMQIYPLASGFLVVNSLRVERAHQRTLLQADDGIYRDGAGLIHMCANCRRTRRADSSDVWDWVPEYLDGDFHNKTHGVCPVCREYYYPDSNSGNSKH